METLLESCVSSLDARHASMIDGRSPQIGKRISEASDKGPGNSRRISREKAVPEIGFNSERLLIRIHRVG